MRTKMTKKEIKETGMLIFSVGYCNLQYLLRTKQPFANSTDSYGWASDYYAFDNFTLSTGYWPIGEKIPYNITTRYEKEARKTSLDNLGDLVNRFEAEITKLIEDKK